jgi:hypothetical protein
MPWQSPRKIPRRVTKRIVNSKMPFANRIGNRIHRRIVFTTIIIILIVILGTIIGNSASSRNVAYANSVRGIGVGIYWDRDCTNSVLSLDWGLIEPGANSTVMVYVRNEGDSAVSLWKATHNWTPSVASDYMTLDWTYSGRNLGANEVIPIELILDVSPTISGITDFSLDIIITATG